MTKIEFTIPPERGIRKYKKIHVVVEKMQSPCETNAITRIVL